MLQENDAKRPQSKGQDHQNQNDRKGQVNGVPSIHKEGLSNGKETWETDPYSSAENSADEKFRTRKYHDDIIRALIDVGGKGPKPNLEDRRYRKALLKRNDDKQSIIRKIMLELQRRMKAPSPETLACIEEVVLQDPNLFIKSDWYTNIPMLEAAKSEVTILFRVIDLLIPEEIRERIRVKCTEGMECPLWAVATGRRTQCKRNGKSRSAGDRRLSTAKKVTFGDASEDSDKLLIRPGTRCLHEDIDSEMLLEKDQELREALESVLGNEKHAQACLESLISEAKFDTGQSTLSRPLKVESFKIILTLCPQSIFTKPLQDGYTPLQRAVRLFDSESIDLELLFSVIQLLVNHCPRSIFCKKNKEEKTAYRLLSELDLKRPKGSSKDRSWIQTTVDFLKERCIGYRNEVTNPKDQLAEDNKMWSMKRDLLYWDAKTERRFSLNFTGDSVILDEPYIEIIQSRAGMCFESILDFVKLPYWRPAGAKLYRPTQPGYSDRRPETAPDVMTDPYINIFEWLWSECRVQKIFTVDVDDDGLEPHTNSTIRQCFRGRNNEPESYRDFKIEVWKWKKFDICSETVVAAAPAAREVHLYSSGNTAVLRGWACELGLARLMALEKLIIEIHPKNVNDEQDCRDYERELKQELMRNCKGLKAENVVINNYGVGIGKRAAKGNISPGRGSAMAGQLTNKDTPQSREWIDELKSFKSFLINLKFPDDKPSSEPPMVKVAILDDGAKLGGLNGIQKGKSFNPNNEEYFVGPCEHGTQMAMCVRKICPMAALYIARLDDSYSKENQKFTISSCYEALQWALEMDVDVISMSWTYERKDGMSDMHKQKFEGLIRKIVDRKKPILIGSLPDMGAQFELHQFVPVGIEGVIRISSATLSGKVSAENVHTKSDFLLPGEGLISDSGKDIRGSSFATAYAAGLVALVLYALRAYDLIRDDVDAEDAKKALDIAETIKGMCSIFNVLGEGDLENKGERGRFLRPALTFRKTFADDKEGEKRDLGKIVKELVPPKVMRATYNGMI